jgi:hypothetical protein
MDQTSLTNNLNEKVKNLLILFFPKSSVNRVIFNGHLLIMLLFLMITVLVFLMGCKYSADNEIIIKKAQLKEDNNLIYQVEIETKDSGEVFIEYHRYQDTSRYYSTLVTGNHVILNLLGLKPGTDYEYIVHARVKDEKLQSPPLKFHSGELPEGLPQLTLQKKSYNFNGFILLKTFFNPGALMLIDDQAGIVWYHLYDTTTVRAFNYNPEGTILSLVDSSKIEVRNFNDELIREINTNSKGIDKLHHDAIQDKEGNVIGLSYTRKIMDLTSIGGKKMDTVNGDGIVVFNLKGDKIWGWDVFDHVDPLQHDSLMYLKNDWIHANSINFDQDGNFLLSLRNINQIWKVDRTNGQVLWKLGIGGDFLPGSKNQTFIHQHDVHINRFGDLMMFDNGLNNRGFSRILSLKLYEKQLRWESEIDIHLDKEHTTFRMGSARFIDKDHILVGSPKRFMQISIMDTNGNILWNVLSNKSSYRAIYLDQKILHHHRWF